MIKSLKEFDYVILKDEKVVAIYEVKIATNKADEALQQIEKGVLIT